MQVYDREIRIGPKQLSEASGVHEELILELERVGILCSDTTDIGGRPLFSSATLRRCREIDRLHQYRHLSYHFIRRFIGLQERLDRAEQILRATGIQWEP